MRKLTSVAMATSMLLAWGAMARAEDGRKRRAAPHEYGRVTMSAAAAKAKVAAVVFDHWSHRARHTCRVCHVDVGFAMVSGATSVRAADNARGQYCGACHNGKTRAAEGRLVFPACSLPGDATRAPCVRCHVGNRDEESAREFAAFARGLPRGRLGNGIDWEAAEKSRAIAPADFVEGLSVPRTAMATQKDFSLSAKLVGMPDIIFSHAKHTVWSGCEGCHPDPFGIKRGSNKVTMTDIFEGRSCGLCHKAVAFPTTDCQRCHRKPVQ